MVAMKWMDMIHHRVIAIAFTPSEPVIACEWPEEPLVGNETQKRL